MYLLWKQQKIVAEAWSGKISLPCVPKASNGGFILEKNQTPFPKRVCRRCRRGIGQMERIADYGTGKGGIVIFCGGSW